MQKALTSILLATAISMPAMALSPEADETAILGVVNAFNEAIVEHDEAAMLELFLSPDAVFASIRGDGSGGRVQLSNAAGFAAMIGNDDGNEMSETFFDIEIQIGEATATMMSQFDFVMNGDVGNHGYETWSLLRVGEDWKIASVVWSSNGPRPAAE